MMPMECRMDSVSATDWKEKGVELHIIATISRTTVLKVLQPPPRVIERAARRSQRRRELMRSYIDVQFRRQMNSAV